jgi:hypothetical protein
MNNGTRESDLKVILWHFVRNTLSVTPCALLPDEALGKAT